MQVGYFIGLNRDFKLIEIPVFYENSLFVTHELFEDCLLFDLFINQQRYFYKGFNSIETHAFNNNLSVELIQERFFRSQGSKVEFELSELYRLSCCDFSSRIPLLTELVTLPNYRIIINTTELLPPNSEYDFTYALVPRDSGLTTIVDYENNQLNEIVLSYDEGIGQTFVCYAHHSSDTEFAHFEVVDSNNVGYSTFTQAYQIELPPITEDLTIYLRIGRTLA